VVNSSDNGRCPCSQARCSFDVPADDLLHPKLLKPAEVPNTWAELAADAKADPSKYKLVTYPVNNPLNYARIYGLIRLLGADKVWSYFDAMAPASKTFNEGLDALTQIHCGGFADPPTGPPLGP
jgi:hypothetical protein